MYILLYTLPASIFAHVYRFVWPGQFLLSRFLAWPGDRSDQWPRPPSRPNKVVDEWCMTVCSMTRYKVKVKVMSPWKSEIRPFSKAISSPFTMGLANIIFANPISGPNFDIWHSFCVMWLWSWQKRHLWGVNRQSRTGLIIPAKAREYVLPALVCLCVCLWPR